MLLSSLKSSCIHLKMMFFRNLGNVEETKRKHQTAALSASSFCYVRTDDKQYRLGETEHSCTSSEAQADHFDFLGAAYLIFSTTYQF